MLESYWRKYIDAKIAAEYYFLYSHKSRKQVWTINAVCLLVTGGSLTAWVTDMLPAAVACLLILAAQSVSLLQPLFPFTDRLYASRQLYREYTNLTTQTERKLERVLQGRDSEESLAEDWEHLRADMDAIEDKFSTSDLFPRSDTLHVLAESSAAQYLKTHFEMED